jgi:arsenate reductase
LTEITIYHNPRCSKSRRTLAILRESGIEPNIVDYLNTPPDQKTLERILRLLNVQPRELIRKSEPEYTALDLANPTLTDEHLISMMVRYPRLIERPIVIRGDEAILGRPPENVKALL